MQLLQEGAGKTWILILEIIMPPIELKVVVDPGRWILIFQNPFCLVDRSSACKAEWYVMIGGQKDYQACSVGL